MTQAKITMHVVGPDDDPQNDNEETFVFDVDEDDASTTAAAATTTTTTATSGGGAAGTDVEIQWLASKSSNELDEIEQQVAAMQQEMMMATVGLERAMSESSQRRVASPQARIASPTPPPRIASPTPPARVGSPVTTQPSTSVTSHYQQRALPTPVRNASRATPALATPSSLSLSSSSSSMSTTTSSSGIGGASGGGNGGGDGPTTDRLIGQLAAAMGIAVPSRPHVLAPGGEDLSVYAWYNHDVNRDMAEMLLKDRPIGTFLVRPSSQNACLALSHKQPDYSVGHMLLRYWDTPLRRGYSKESEPETYASVVDVLHSLPLGLFLMFC